MLMLMEQTHASGQAWSAIQHRDQMQMTQNHQPPADQEAQQQLLQQEQQEEEHVDDQQQEEQRVLQPLQPSLQLRPVQLVEVAHACAHVTWPQADYTLPDHDDDEEQVTYQLQVHYRISYTLQVQQAPLGPPTAKESVEQLLASTPSAVQETAWKDVLTLEEPPTQPQRVGSLRAGRFYAARLRACAYADLDTGPVQFSDTFVSDVLAFRTLPCSPGQMQAPSLARRDRTLLKLKWNLPDETGGEEITQYQLKVKPLPPGFAGSPPDEEGFSIIYEGEGEGAETSKDRTHFTLKPLGPGQKYSFRMRCFNALGVGNWSLPSTFTTAPSVPSQPEAPELMHAEADAVTLQWQPPADNGSAITFYKLEMDDGRGGDFHHVYGGQAEQLSTIVTGLQSGLHYRVRLRAENGEGRSQWSVVKPITTAATRPCCPVGLKLGQITRTAVSLSWSPPDDDGGSPVGSYEVQLQAVSKLAVANLGPDWLTIYQGPGLSTNWSALRAGCKYQLRVAACNGVGCSQFSIPVTFVTSADAPLPPPRPTALVDKRALFINLEPPVHDGGAALTGYSILMRCSADAAAAAAAACHGAEPRPFMSSNWQEVWRGECKGSAVHVPNLLPGTKYEFRAAAINSFGSSTPSEAGSAVTPPAEPLPPAPPQLAAGGSSSVAVSWQEPYGQGSAVSKYKLSIACLGPIGSGGSAGAGGSSVGHSRSSSIAAPSANGHMDALGHAMENGDDAGSVSSSSGACSSSGPTVDKLRWEQAYSGPERCATIKQLQPAHRYLVRVRAINECGPSHWSQQLAVTTGAAAPGAPARVWAVAEGSSSVAVSWQPPEVDNGAPVTTYHLEVQAQGGAGTAGWVSVWQGSKTSHTVHGLLPGRKYSWRVRAGNSCGLGPWSAPAAGSTAPAVPDAPSKPATSKVTATSAKVKWAIPLEDNGAPVKAYSLQLRRLQVPATAAAAADDDSSAASEAPSEPAAWQEVYAGPLLDTSISQLQPGSSYEVRVAAINAVGWSRWSAAAELATPLKPPPPPTELAAVPCDDAQQGCVLSVTWQLPVAAAADMAATVSVYVEAAAAGSKEAAAKATVPVGEVSRAVLQGLRPGGSYSVRARAVGAGSTGHSTWCEPVVVVLPATAVPEQADAAAGALVPADPGKRGAKARGSKAAAVRAAAAEDSAGSGTEAAPKRRAGRATKAVVVVEPQAHKLVKKKTALARFRSQAWKLFKKYWFALLVLCVVVYLVRRLLRG